MGVPIFSGRTIDAAEAWYRGEADLDRVLDYAILLAGIGVLGGVLRFISRVLVFNAAREIEYEIRNDLYAHLQRLPQSFFFGQRTGDLMSRATSDVEAARMVAGPAFMYLLDSVLRIAFAIPAMLSLNVDLTLISLLPLGGIFCGLFYFARRGRVWIRVNDR